LALQWVQKYISNFWGNPKEVTIAGESAGGMAVFLHMFIPSSYGLYKRVIVESNPVSLHYRTPEEDVPYSEKFARDAGCETPDNVTCLMDLTMEHIIAIDGTIEWIIKSPLRTSMILPWCPALDGTFLPYQPIDVLPLGKFNRVPVIWATTKDETSAFLPWIPVLADVYIGIVDDIFGKENGTKVLAMYPPNGNESRVPAVEASTDYLMTCANRYAAWAYQNFSTYPTYIETWMRPVINASQRKCENVSCHACELPYVFHTLDGHPDHPPPIPPEDYQLSLDVIYYWSQFINGKMDTPPTNLTAKENVNLEIVWPAWNYKNKPSLFLDAPVTSTTAYRQQYCDFWDQMGYYV